MIVIETSESVYLNPYFVTVDNQSLLSIYSIHSKSKVIVQYQLCSQTSKRLINIKIINKKVSWNLSKCIMEASQ